MYRPTRRRFYPFIYKGTSSSLKAYLIIHSEMQENLSLVYNESSSTANQWFAYVNPSLNYSTSTQVRVNTTLKRNLLWSHFMVCVPKLIPGSNDQEKSHLYPKSKQFRISLLLCCKQVPHLNFCQQVLNRSSPCVAANIPFSRSFTYYFEKQFVSYCISSSLSRNSALDLFVYGSIVYIRQFRFIEITGTEFSIRDDNIEVSFTSHSLFCKSVIFASLYLWPKTELWSSCH